MDIAQIREITHELTAHVPIFKGWEWRTVERIIPFEESEYSEENTQRVPAEIDFDIITKTAVISVDPRWDEWKATWPQTFRQLIAHEIGHAAMCTDPEDGATAIGMAFIAWADERRNCKCALTSAGRK